jgi:hypothetical protein
MAEMRDKPAGKRKLTLTSIGTFVAALLVAIGLGSAVSFWRRRHGERAAEREQQRADERAEELARKRAIGHEASNPRVGRILLLAAGLVGVIATGLAALWLLFAVLQSRAEQADVPISPLATAAQLAPGPRLQANPSADWQQVRATAEALLGSYGQGSGDSVRIPIDRAMELIAQRGLPARNALSPGDYDQAHQYESNGGQPPGTFGAQAQPSSLSQAPAPPTPTATTGTTRSVP